MAFRTSAVRARTSAPVGRGTTASTSSPFWYTGGVNRSGAPALAAGVAASAACADTVYSEPVAAALGGIDLALPVGLLMASGVYAVSMRALRRPG
ncbi:hypothetical protein [Streptomyces sp. BK340]|uniref:hypothetical protein n=1 Tax=Streptomyces sp. BK340 TaxID=2572903 RepID=UPI0016475AB6|nr:hypothetical protein [Streptomyces sp. BK340]